MRLEEIACEKELILVLDGLCVTFGNVHFDRDTAVAASVVSPEKMVVYAGGQCADSKLACTSFNFPAKVIDLSPPVVVVAHTQVSFSYVVQDRHGGTVEALMNQDVEN